MNIRAALVRSILEKWESYQWSVQGFGMLRTKIADVGRIHVWDSSLTRIHVSTMHTHPWDLRSEIISGEMINQRFEESSTGTLQYNRQTIKTGEKGGPNMDVKEVLLRSCQPEVYHQGQAYTQSSNEIHRSSPQDGTVTLMERPQGPPLEEALVYWPRGTQWMTAEPEEADVRRVTAVIAYALARWNA